VVTDQGAWGRGRRGRCYLNALSALGRVGLRGGESETGKKKEKKVTARVARARVRLDSCDRVTCCVIWFGLRIGFAR
jgi:hypothetical protein